MKIKKILLKVKKNLKEKVKIRKKVRVKKIKINI